MTSSAALERGRTAFAEHRWSDALDALTEADGDGLLEGVDLECFSTAALLLGRDTLGIDLATRAHEAFLALTTRPGRRAPPPGSASTSRAGVTWPEAAAGSPARSGWP